MTNIIHVAQSNAWHYIGKINPGIGYWWEQTSNGWQLCLLTADGTAAPPQENFFWPVFLMVAAVGIAIIELRRSSDGVPAHRGQGFR